MEVFVLYNNKRRSIIIGIDNRATELNRDLNLPVVNQENISNLSKIINSNFKNRNYITKNKYTNIPFTV